MITPDGYISHASGEYNSVNIITQSRITKPSKIQRSKRKLLGRNLKGKFNIKNKKHFWQWCFLGSAKSSRQGTSECNVECFDFLKKNKFIKACSGIHSKVLCRMHTGALDQEPLVGSCPVDRRRVCINVSGKRHETYESTLAKYPDTLLALPQRELFYDSLNGEYFFDRNRKAFGAILAYCQTGVLAKPANLDDRIFAADLRFFGFEAESQAHMPPTNVSEPRVLPKSKIFKAVWQTFEYPDTSLVARVTSLFSMFVIVLSIVMFCVETLPFFREHATDFVRGENGTIIGIQHVGDKTKADYEWSFFIIEACCITWFTMEYLLRLLSAPNRLSFLHQPLNIIDVVAILPFYITLGLKATDTDISRLSILRVLRLVRVFRIFKLSRYSKGLKILGYTFRASLRELGLLGFFLLIGIILFSSAAYYCEESVEGTGFRSIPHSFWWAIVTMTTVGYGDITPTTFGGKIVGSLCVLVGVLTIAFPVPVIVNNFTYYYTLEQGIPDPLDEEYMENPLSADKDGMSCSGSVAEETSDAYFDDQNRNGKKLEDPIRNGHSEDQKAMLELNDKDYLETVHCHVESNC